VRAGAVVTKDVGFRVEVCSTLAGGDGNEARFFSATKIIPTHKKYSLERGFRRRPNGEGGVLGHADQVAVPVS